MAEIDEREVNKAAVKENKMISSKDAAGRVKFGKILGMIVLFLLIIGYKNFALISVLMFLGIVGYR